MNDSANSIVVKIMGQEYKVKCPPDKITELQDSASYLDHLMQEIREGSNINSAERVAVIAALNIANDMLVLKRQKQAYIDMLSQRIQALHEKIAQSLSPQEAIV